MNRVLRAQLRHCLDGLCDGRLYMLARHVKNGDLILVGEHAGPYFTWEEMSDPVIYACFKGRYPNRCATFQQLDSSVQQVYDIISHRVPNSDYSNILEDISQDDAHGTVMTLARDRHIKIW